jgi:hypothetical protein
MLGTVDEGKYIRLLVALEGEIVTWYSIEADPHSQGAAENEMVFAESVITFWLYPSIADKSKLMLHYGDVFTTT